MPSLPARPSLEERLRRRIRENGPLSFHDFMEAALYDPESGYYNSSRSPIGPEGDFYTSSDLDPVFGFLLARKFAGLAAEAGATPESFAIVELGGGRGLLAREILRNAPFPYCILERSPAMRERQRQNLQGFNVEWIDELPRRLTGCVFSNEFFDALPVHRVVRRGGRLREIYVNADLTEVDGDLQVQADVPIGEGEVTEIGVESEEWIERIAASLSSGYHVAIDYGYLDREYFARPAGTLMCYWQHQAFENPYVRIGEQDITAHVNFSRLMDAGRSAGLETLSFSTQMEFLIGLGVLEELEALTRSRSANEILRVQAIKKLLLPGGMGERFKVLVQRKA